MKLYKILIRHCAPKGCEKSIIGYFLAKNDEVIYNYIDKELTYDVWGERQASSIEDPIELYDDDYNMIGTELYKDKMLRLRGEFFDPDASYDDAHYGVTHYGWEEGLDILDEQQEMLVILNIAQVLL